MTTILHKRNINPGLPPSPSSLSAGEIAINIADGNLYTKTINETVKTFLNSDYQPYVLNKTLSSVVTQYGSNQVAGIFATVLGGYHNEIEGSGSAIINGENNYIAGDFATIGNGFNNTIELDGECSAILGGRNNVVSHSDTFVLGSNISSHQSGFTYINNLSVLGKIYGDGSEISNVPSFALTKVTTASHTQTNDYTHTLYDDDAANGQMVVYLLPPNQHKGVTQHKKIGVTANVVLTAPLGSTIDGQATFVLSTQYQSIGLYTDGINYFVE